MLHRPKAFTLIEMVLVIVIIGILMSLSSSLFIKSNNPRYYAETCANYLYGSIKNFHYDALVGKQPEGVSNIERYYLTIEDDTTVTYQYGTGGSILENLTTAIDLTTANTQRKCISDTTQVILTGSTSASIFPLSLTISKNLSQTQSGAMILQTDNTRAYTGTIAIKLHNTTENTYQDIAQIRIDTRNQNITKHMCRQFNRSSGTCEKR